jgi:DNA helicase HerA-like ATPase
MTARSKAGKRASTAPNRETYEKLGTFYLGKTYDIETRQRGGLFLYDSKDLVTHAVCVGMTGSGKTGLGIGLLEEAALDGIPALVIDPKGDLSDLLLTFPALRPEDFLPWVNADEAGRQNLTVEAFAAQQAQSWTKGLAEWGQDGDRIARLRAAADFAIYTPGSRAGLPLSVLRSLSVPSAALAGDEDLYRERLVATASGLLALLGLPGGSTPGREQVLLSNLLDSAWRQGQSLDLVGLVGLIQSPPFTRLGALDLETFYPATQRAELAAALNTFVASPGFQAWMEGEAMDPEKLLWTGNGRPRVAIISLAHLGDAERMFVVTALLNEVLAWARAQPGTTSLRAILFMDEIFGFFPPVAAPPSKAPMLSLLKTGRAYGLGVCLTSQNPADLDYKGLSNAGTWFIGRLQTERDRERLLDGLETLGSRGGGWDRGWLDKAITGLEKRVFLVNNVHDDAPSALQTRWTMSYLRGPITRQQIQNLMDPYRRTVEDQPGGKPGAPTATPDSTPADSPVALPSSIPQVFLPGGGSSTVYRPMLLAAARLRIADRKLKVDTLLDEVFLAEIKDAPIPVDWADGRQADVSSDALQKNGAPGASFRQPAPAAARASNYADWKKDFVTWLASSHAIEIWRSPATGLLSQPGEAEPAFRGRVSLALREARDQETDQLRRKYAPKMKRLEDRLRRAQQAVDRESEQARQQKAQTAISFGATVLGAFVGRKAISATTLGRATTAARGATRSAKEDKDVERAEENADAIQEQLKELEAEFQAEADSLQAGRGGDEETLEAISLRAKKGDIAVQLLALAWVP